MEVEIKLNVRPAILGGPAMLFARLSMMPELAGLPLGPIRKYEIRDVYFDTEGGALAAAGAGLRLRIVNETPFVTLKRNRFQDGSLTEREEFEEPVTQERLDWVLSHVKEQVGEGPFPAEAFLGGASCGPLARVLEVGTARLLRPIGAVADLVMDMVEYPGVSANPYFDIELEARKGEHYENFLRKVETELYTLAGGDLAPASGSKLERGLKLQGRVKMGL